MMVPLVAELKTAGELALADDVQKQQRIALQAATGLENVSAQIATDLDGTLSARNRKGGGAVFELALPLLKSGDDSEAA